MAFWYNTPFCRNVIYMFPEDGSHDLGARYVFHYKANDVITDKICYVWIQTHTRWFRTYGNGWSDLTTKIKWSSIYLTEEKCLQVKKLMAHFSFWYITSNDLSLCRYLFYWCSVHRNLFVDCHTVKLSSSVFQAACVGSVRMNNMLGVGRPWMQCNLRSVTLIPSCIVQSPCPCPNHRSKWLVDHFCRHTTPTTQILCGAHASMPTSLHHSCNHSN